MKVVKGIEGNKLIVGSKETFIYVTWKVWPSLDVYLNGWTYTIGYNVKYKVE